MECANDYELVEKLVHKYQRIAILKLCVVSTDSKLQTIYENAVDNHNNKLINNMFMDAGFDLFYTAADFSSTNPTDHWLKINFQVKAEMKLVHFDHMGERVDVSSGYYVYPRSSLSKTNLRLANNTGIIDSGYRGCLMGMFDNLLNHSVEVDPSNCVKQYDRVLQICAPGLVPMLIKLVNENDLSTTERAEGGIGSTGK